MKDAKLLSEVVSSISTPIITLITGGNPESIIFSAGIQPLVKRAFESIFSNICCKNFTERDCIRLGVSYQAAVSKINENLANGISFRTDDLFKNNNNYSKADDILESVMKSSINDTEQKKSYYYGYFMGNLPFAPEVDYSSAISLQKIIHQLTYFHLCIIVYIKRNDVINPDKWKKLLHNTNDIKGFDIIHGIKEIVRFDLTEKVAPFSLGEEIGNIKLGTFGELIYKLMSLDKIDDTDLLEIEDFVNRMNI